MGTEELATEKGTKRKSEFETQKQLVEDLKMQWKQMWSERYNDKVIAEGVSVNDYAELSVERGAILHASRAFKPLNFQDVLKAHKIEKPDRYVPNRAEGGWNKFIQTKVRSHKETMHKDSVGSGKHVQLQAKKGGRGWLHSV